MSDKKEIKDNFSRSGDKYETLAVMQRELADQLFNQLAAYNLSPNTVLDLGCGSGYLTRKIAERYPQAAVTGVDLAPGMIAAAEKIVRSNLKFIEGDIEAPLPLADGICDLIVSNASLHWTDLTRVLPQIQRLLAPGGSFLFNTFGPATLKELKTVGFCVNDYPAAKEWQELAAGRFLVKNLSSSLLVRKFSGVKQLVNHLKNTGVNSTLRRGGGGDFFRSLAEYKRHFALSDGSVAATYEIISGEFCGN